MTTPYSAETEVRHALLGGSALGPSGNGARRTWASHLIFAVSVSVVMLGVLASALSAPDPEVSRESADALVMEAGDGTVTPACSQTYGIFPCSTSLGGSLFLTLIYGSILTYGAQCIGDGGEAFLDQKVLSPSIIGGIVLPVLGAIPDAAIIFVSTISSGSRVEAERKVSVGVGTLAGSTIMLLTIAYSGSLWLGRCDLVEGSAVDKLLDGKPFVASKFKDSFFNFFRHAFTTGVTHDEGVLRVKWFMVATSCLYLCAQVPAWLLHDAVYTQQAALCGAIACGVFLVIYLIDGVYQNSEDGLETAVERRKVKTEMRRDEILTAVSRFTIAEEKQRKISQTDVPLHGNSSKTSDFHAQYADRTHSLTQTIAQTGRRISGVELIDTNSGVVNREAIGRMFDVFDVDRSGYLDETETDKFIKVVFMSAGETEVPDEVTYEIQKAQRSSKHKTAPKADCFGKKEPTEALISRNAFLDHIAKLMEMQYQKLVQEQDIENQKLAQEVEEEEEEEQAGMSVMEATVTIIFGTVLATIFSDALVETIDDVGQFSGVPNFVIGFVVCPLASNASELISSLQLASRKKARNASVTFAQIYAACTMNNCLGLGVFFFMVWYKKLDWNYGAEVSSIIVVTWIIAFVTSCDTTIKTWMVFPSLMLYPLSLLAVETLHHVWGIQ